MNDPRKVAPLLAALRDHDFSVRISAVHSLQHVMSEQVTGEILKLFRDSDNHVRVSAAQVMARRQDAVPAHFLGLLEEENFELRLVAVQFLGKIRNPQIAEVLMPRLSDPDVDIRQETASSLGVMGNPSAIEPLVLCLADEDRMVRRSALRSLEQIDAYWFQTAGAQNARPQLEAMIETSSEWVRSDIQEALGRLAPSDSAAPGNIELQMSTQPADFPASQTQLADS